MHAFLLISTNKPALEYRVKQLAGNNRLLIKPLLKISEVRDLASMVKLTVTNKTFILVPNFDKSSEEAQNAFLKNLEEPLKNITYILTARSDISILPTIISRCLVEEINSHGGQDEFHPDTGAFITGGVGDRLAITSKIRSREEAATFVDSLLDSISKKVHDKHGAHMVECLLGISRDIDKNANVQLALTKLVVMF